MANSNAVKEIKIIKINKEGKVYSKTSLDEKCEEFIKKKYSLKSCYIPLQKVDEINLDNAKQSSQDSNESIVVPCTRNKVETSKIINSILHKSNKTFKDLKKTVNITLVQNKNSVSASSSAVSVYDCTSCYVALEKLAVPINHFIVYSPEKEEIIRNVAVCSSGEHSNSRNISPNPKIDNNSKIHNSSFEFEMPCSESKLIPSVSESNVKQSVFNSTQDSNDGKKGPFISELSTLSSSESEKNQKSNSVFLGISSMPVGNKRIDKGNNAIFTSTPSKRRRISSSGSDSSKLDAGKGTETLDDDQKSVPSKHRRISSFDSDFSKIDVCKGTEKIVDNQKSVETNESLSSVHYARKEAEQSEDLKCIKRTAKLLSFSSDSSSLENYQSSFRSRKGIKSKHEHRKCQIKRDFSDRDCISLGDSDSTVYNSSLDTAQSHKQTLKNQEIEVPTTSYILRAFNRNVEKNYSMYKKKNICSKMCDKNKTVSTSKCKSSNSSETEENFSDNSLSNSNKKMPEHKQFKHSFRRNHSRTKKVHSSCTLRKSVNKHSSLEKSAASDISNNSERGQECHMPFKYDIKPCCVFLEDAGKNNIDSSTGNQFNDLHQKNPPKARCEIDCLESKSSKQIHFSKGKKLSKSMKCIEKKSFDDNKDYKTVEECILLTDSDDLSEYEKDHMKKCSDYVDTNSMHESQSHGIESHYKAPKMEIKEMECHFSDSSNSSLNLDIIFHNSDFLKKTMKSDNKNSSENDFSENCLKVVNHKEENLIISGKKCSSVNKDNIKSETKVICDDPDWDEAYFADTDERSDKPESALKNDNCFSSDNCKPSANLSVNVLRSEIDGINTTKKIPYCYLGSKTKSDKNDDRFVFKSKINGSVYIVDFFEYENIKKIFVTIRWEKGTVLYSNNDSNRISSPTLSERIEALGGFNRIDANTCLRLNATSVKHQHENKQKYPGKENISKFDKVEVLDRKKNSEPLNTDSSRSGLSLPCASLSDDTTLSITSSDHSDNKYDEFCVHCCAKFSSKKESYNHTCEGKLQKGYLCVYCEIVVSSYSKLQSHRKLHYL